MQSNVIFIKLINSVHFINTTIFSKLLNVTLLFKKILKQLLITHEFNKKNLI